MMRADRFGYSRPFERCKIAYKVLFHFLFEAIQVFLRGQNIRMSQGFLYEFGTDTGS
jgi:hypothetical protein